MSSEVWFACLFLIALAGSVIMCFIVAMRHSKNHENSSNMITCTAPGKCDLRHTENCKKCKYGEEVKSGNYFDPK